MSQALKCDCGTLVYVSEPKIKIRSKLVFVEGDVVKALCRNCSCEHELPLDINKSVTVPVETEDDLTLYVPTS